MTKYRLMATAALTAAVAFAAVNQVRTAVALRELERQQRRTQRQVERMQR